MKLLSLEIYNAETCGGLLDGLSIAFRKENSDTGIFDPLCLIGPNGSGKSQLLQVLAEIFQSVFHKYVPEEERGSPNDSIEFELTYLITTAGSNGGSTKVRISRKSMDRRKPDIKVEAFKDNVWEEILSDIEVNIYLPAKVIGYTSGNNETLSLPFFSSRAGYAEEVRTNALDDSKKTWPIRDPRLLLIDYSTSLEVLVANLLLGSEPVKSKLLAEPNLKRLRSFRCVVQLNHPAAPGKEGVKLTKELEGYIDYLKMCATCYSHDPKFNTYIFDYFVSDATYEGFSSHWDGGALELYACFHKLAMLNDLIIPKKARELTQKSVKDRRFASRLPEPFDEHKVFRFERVEFVSKSLDKDVDYASLSDGEHQLAQILGTACMASFPNVLFLLDEPESHFNPRWRVEFIKKMLNLPTEGGARCDLNSPAAQQECLITTHSPFLPSDMQRENVLIFKKPTNENQPKKQKTILLSLSNKDLTEANDVIENRNSIEIRRPEIQTYGSKFDAILAECFDISPPISALSRDRAEKLMNNGTKAEIEDAIAELGESTARMRLAAKLSELEGDI